MTRSEETGNISWNLPRYPDPCTERTSLNVRPLPTWTWPFGGVGKPITHLELTLSWFILVCLRSGQSLVRSDLLCIHSKLIVSNLKYVLDPQAKRTVIGRVQRFHALATGKILLHKGRPRTTHLSSEFSRVYVSSWSRSGAGHLLYSHDTHW